MTLNLTDRAVLDLAESWHWSWVDRDSEPALGESCDLFVAVRQRMNEPCPMPCTMLEDLALQVDLEFAHQGERGWHLVPITTIEVVKGKRVETDCLWLETDIPPVACRNCGAAGHGNIGCLECLRWQKRATPREFGEGLRVLIKIRERLERGAL